MKELALFDLTKGKEDIEKWDINNKVSKNIMVIHNNSNIF